MAKFQKIGLADGKLTFRVICDDGHEEVQTYLVDGKKEDVLMGEVALHINTERMASIVPVEIEEAVSEPLMEVSVTKSGKISVKEAIDEPVA